MDWIQIISLALPALLGGGAIWSVRSTRKKANAEAKGIEIDNDIKLDSRYEKLIDKLDSRIEKLEDKLHELELKLESKDKALQAKRAAMRAHRECPNFKQTGRCAVIEMQDKIESELDKIF